MTRTAASARPGVWKVQCPVCTGLNVIEDVGTDPSYGPPTHKARIRGTDMCNHFKSARRVARTGVVKAVFVP
jgi:hypothetical protein